MKSLYLRIWLTVVSMLGAFAIASGWFVQRHLESERERIENAQSERLSAWAELVQRSLPPADAAPELQGAELREWSTRLRLPMALDDPGGRRIAAADAYLRVTKAKIDRAFLVKILRNPQFQYKVAPTNTYGLAQFLFQAGAIKKQPATWRDYFFDHPALASGS